MGSSIGFMEVRDVAAELLALPLDEFTARRNARARELKQAGKAELAAGVAKLKKPSVQLWAANQVARDDPELLRRLHDAARAVARAQTEASAGTARDLRAASEAFQSALEAAVKTAERRLRQDGHTASDETMRRVREVFRAAAMQDADVWEQLQRGALMTEPSGGDDVLAMFQAAAPVARKKGPNVEAKGEDPHAARAAERAARLDADRAEQLEDVARRLRAEADEAASQAKRAGERARAAEKQAAEARRQADKSAEAVGGRRARELHHGDVRRR